MDLPNSDVEHLIDGLQQGNHYSFLNSPDQGRQPLRHNRDVDDRDDRELCMWRCTMTGTSTTGPRAPPGESHQSSAQFALWVHVSAAYQECPTTVDELDLKHLQSKDCWNLSLHDHRDRTRPPRTRRTPCPAPPLLPLRPHHNGRDRATAPLPCRFLTAGRCRVRHHCLRRTHVVDGPTSAGASAASTASIALYNGATRNGDPWPAPRFPVKCES